MRWQDHLTHDRRRSVHTVRAYGATAHRLIRFLGGHLGQQVDSAALRDLTSADLRAFLSRRRSEGLRNNSAARALSAVRGFLGFAAREEARSVNIPRMN